MAVIASRWWRTIVRFFISRSRASIATQINRREERERERNGRVPIAFHIARWRNLLKGSRETVKDQVRARSFVLSGPWKFLDSYGTAHHEKLAHWEQKQPNLFRLVPTKLASVYSPWGIQRSRGSIRYDVVNFVLVCSIDVVIGIDRVARNCTDPGVVWTFAPSIWMSRVCVCVCVWIDDDWRWFSRSWYW